MNPIDISDYIKCGMCNLGIGNSIRLQCEHVICEPCLEAMINYKFSDNLTGDYEVISSYITSFYTFSYH